MSYEEFGTFSTNNNLKKNTRTIPLTEWTEMKKPNYTPTHNEDIIEKKTDTIKGGVSICITAYKTAKYIEECLDSIESQTYFKDNDDYEVLIGVDDCKETEEKLMAILWKYRNVRAFMMSKNVGTYVASNTMFSMAKYDRIIRFDSDDIMMPKMIEKLMKSDENADIVRFMMKNFAENGKPLPKDVRDTSDAWGQIMVKKETFEKFGGYKPWVCSADSEFLYRTKRHTETAWIREPLFLRRIHDESLTRSKDTGMNSSTRRRYISEIHNSNCDNIKNCIIKKEVEECTEISNGVRVCISTSNGRETSARAAIDSMMKQTLKPSEIICYLSTEDFGKKVAPQCLSELEKDEKIKIRWVKKDTGTNKRCGVFNKQYDGVTLLISDAMVYHKAYVREMVDALMENPNCAICYCDMEKKLGEGNGTFEMKTNQSVRSPFSCDVCAFKYNIFPKEALEHTDVRDEVSGMNDTPWVSAWLKKNNTYVHIVNDGSEGIDIKVNEDIYRIPTEQEMKDCEERVMNI